MVRLSDGSLARGEIRKGSEGIARFGGLVWTGFFSFASAYLTPASPPKRVFYRLRNLTSRMRRRVSNPRPDGSLALKQGNQANPALTVPIVNWSGKLPLADRSECRMRSPAREGMLSTPFAYSYGLGMVGYLPREKGQPMTRENEND